MGTIINILLVICACIVAALLKQNNRQKAAQQPMQPIDTNITSSIDLSGKKPISLTQLTQKQPSSSSTTTATDTGQQRVNTSTDSTNTPKTAVNSPKITRKSTTEDEFDLRKAVIYSEILTPKFKDEDF